MSDLILIHPPSYLQFREEKRKYGPISDVIPSTPLFDMYPYGFLSIYSHLSKKGFRVEIFNLAARMIMDPSFKLREYVRKIDAKLIGIDLHWMVHASGAIELAKVIKEERPEIPLMLGGFSATIFYNEIMENYKWIDMILLGDTTEELFEKVLESQMNPEKMEKIPNLVYRDGGKIKVNNFSYIPEDLSDLKIDYYNIFKNLSYSSEPLWWIPFSDFIEHPIGAVILFKGCRFHCLACGGSSYAYAKYFRRKSLAIKSPSAVIEEVRSITEHLKIPVFIVGDVQLLGKNRWEMLLKKMKEERISTQAIFFEFFTPPPLELIEKVSSLDAEVYFQISPESHSEETRKYYGRPYSNEALMNFIINSINSNIKRVDLYFLVGLPRQTLMEVSSLPKFISEIYKKLPSDKEKQLDFFVAPLAPFVDPGSIAFDFPQKFGYKLRARSVEDHMNLVKHSRDWRGMLNYETYWMSREDIATATYLAAKGLILLKRDIGIIDRALSELLLSRIDESYTSDVFMKETVVSDDLYPSKPIYSVIDERSSSIILNIMKNILGLE
ncbi:MAG: TIGR04190 family B12-binding domain/radical SAM domain protein [Fervidicoccaceae archaeon]|jgi:B12-binding domain/radical SAM domain protein